MQDRFKFKIVVFERNYEPKTDWKFVEIIEDNNNWHLTMCGDIASNDCYYAHYRRNNAPDNVCRVYEPVFCTGLKDKNGKLIFEGDIVQFYDDEVLRTMKIVWDNDEFDFKAIGLKKSVECYKGDFSYLGYIKKEDSLKVIGNIYENAELLEVV